MKVDRRKWQKLSPVLMAAIQEYLDRSKAALDEEDITNKIDAPLYHYTDANGLEGIIKNQQIWFTHYQHLNDPTEVTYGMEVASRVINEIGNKYARFLAKPQHVRQTGALTPACVARDQHLPSF